MGQISIKLPKEEIDFLDWYTKKHATPKATLYREVTLESFRKWKHNLLLNDYMKGEISFKNFCILGNLSFFEGMVLVEESDLEPIIPDIIDEYTNKLTDLNIKNKDLSIFKDRKAMKRTSPEITFNDGD